VASYVNTLDNVIADTQSRLNVEQEWSLGASYFANICLLFGAPSIDLFASYNTNKCARYISWHPDPNAENIDAFLVDWNSEFFYAFPPFCLVTKVLRKVVNEKARGILVVPYWPSQPWFSFFLRILEGEHSLLGPSKYLLLCPLSSRAHPLYRSLKLAVGIVSGQC
jgi:hypothetical protein